MPIVKKSLFSCPLCGLPTHVLRSRRALAQRIVRYRRCPDGHRTRTCEIVDIERTPGSVRLVLSSFIKTQQTSADSCSITPQRKDN